jgi:hypothetical protein
MRLKAEEVHSSPGNSKLREGCERHGPVWASLCRPNGSMKAWDAIGSEVAICIV